MAPPLHEAAPSPVMTDVRDKNQEPVQETGNLLPHRDPTFAEVARRVDWGKADWKLTGPAFSDGTKPEFEINWRLGEIIIKILMKYANAKMSRTMTKEFERGASVTRIRLVKKLTPTAVLNANPGRNGGSTQTEIQEGLNS